ncbi:MAG TPA: hypothetical protein DEF79_04490, partial [Gammaproteobacteria bacterium]|nr:hypothetical protein [Gammaproteobacteria bacterium]
EVDVLTAGLKTGDHLLICTDGLTDMVADWQIREILKEYSYSSEAAVHKLVEAANYHGGRDNISVILAQVCTE